MSDHLRYERTLERLRGFVAARQWERFHDPKNLAMALASETGELLAELRWLTGPESDAVMNDPEARARIENEIADVAIAVFLFCNRTGIDLLAAVDRKIDINEQNYPEDVARGVAERRT